MTEQTNEQKGELLPYSDQMFYRWKNYGQSLGLAWDVATMLAALQITPRWNTRTPATCKQDLPVDPNRVVAGRRMDRSNADFERACCVLINEQVENPNGDSHIVAVLADAVRLCREYTDAMTSVPRTDQTAVELVKQALAAMSYHRDLDQRLHDLHRNCRCMICRAIQAAEEWLKGKI